MQIQQDFGIDASEELALSVDTWRLLPCCSTAMLRDNDNVKVSRSTWLEPPLQVGPSHRVTLSACRRQTRFYSDQAYA